MLTAIRTPAYDVIPKFDDEQCTGTGTAGLVDTREEYIRSAYVDADEKLGVARELMGGNPTTFAGSDHGFAPQWYAVNANKVLHDATVDGKSLHVSNANASNCSAIVPVSPGPGQPVPPVSETNTDLTKACWAGGTIQIYINPARLRSTDATDVADLRAGPRPRSGMRSTMSATRPTPASRSSSGS